MSARADNKRHRDCAQALVDTYSNMSGETDNATNLVDMLADLRHWAKGKRLDFDRALGSSSMHFDAEVQS